VIVLGIDPGAHTGWATVEDGKRVIDFGVLTPDEAPERVRAILSDSAIGLVAIEKVIHVHPVVRKGKAGISTVQTLALIDAGWLGGDLRRVALTLGVPTITFAAEEWRKAMIGKPTADNAMIDRVLRLRLRDFPAPRKSANHERDAMGIAAYGALRARVKGAA
jgi:Holliday junction resolvasome RuvABC endonuclease subunit